MFEQFILVWKTTNETGKVGRNRSLYFTFSGCFLLAACCFTTLLSEILPKKKCEINTVTKVLHKFQRLDRFYSTIGTCFGWKKSTWHHTPGCNIISNTRGQCHKDKIDVRGMEEGSKLTMTIDNSTRFSLHSLSTSSENTIYNLGLQAHWEPPLDRRKLLIPPVNSWIFIEPFYLTKVHSTAPNKGKYIMIGIQFHFVL